MGERGRKIFEVMNPIAIHQAIEFVKNKRRTMMNVRSHVLGRRFDCEVNLIRLVRWVDRYGYALREIPILPVILSDEIVPITITGISEKNANQIIFT